MFVDDKTMNVLGKRTDGTTRNELIVRVYASTRRPRASPCTRTTGTTIGYQTGAVRTTDLSQQRSGTTATVTIAASAGTYTGAPSSGRTWSSSCGEPRAHGRDARRRGPDALRHPGRAFDAAASGWYNAGARAGRRQVGEPERDARRRRSSSRALRRLRRSRPEARTLLTNQNSGKCVDASESATANGTVVQQYTCNTSTAQQWVFTATDGGYYQVASSNAVGQVWDVKDVLTTDYATVNLWANVGATNQQWQPTVVTGPYYQLAARHSAKCLDVPDASTADVDLQQ